jgi:NhaP-type Na+/H+ or K+/H+ antiporter
MRQVSERVCRVFGTNPPPLPPLVMLVGIIFGSIVCGISDSWGEKLDFNEHLFALIFLPVIIFQSGYSLSLSRFFKRIGKILTFAFLGTFITTMFIGGSLYGLSDAGLTGQVSDVLGAPRGRIASLTHQLWFCSWRSSRSTFQRALHLQR